MNIKYLTEFRTYLDTKDIIIPTKPKERATLMFKFGTDEMLSILNALNVDDKKSLAIKMVAHGHSYVDVSCVLECSSTTIKKWINTTYDLLIRKGT